MRDAMAARHGAAIGDAVLEAVFRDGDTLDGTTNMENDLVPLRRSQACAGSSRCPPRGLAGAAVCATCACRTKDQGQGRVGAVRQCDNR